VAAGSLAPALDGPAMKKVKIPATWIIKPTPGSPVNVGEAFDHLLEVQANAQRIMSATFGIESQLDNIIIHRVFGKFGAEVSFFSEHILASDWFTFSAKRKLVISIVQEKKVLAGQERNPFEKVLRDVMSYRNIFAHGRVTERSDGTYISYFEGGPQERLLSDEYWTNVEATFNEALQSLMTVQVKMGISTGTHNIAESQSGSNEAV
jgi:hypothetical protein